MGNGGLIVKEWTKNIDVLVYRAGAKVVVGGRGSSGQNEELESLLLITSFVTKTPRFRWHRFDGRYQIDGRRPRNG